MTIRWMGQRKIKMTRTTSYKLVTPFSAMVLFLLATNRAYTNEPDVTKKEAIIRLQGKAAFYQKAMIMKQLEVDAEKKKVEENNALVKSCNAIPDGSWEDMKNFKMKPSEEYQKCQSNAKHP